LLGADVTIVHLTGLSDNDLDSIGSSGAGVALTPSSDMTTGPGTPPMQDLLDRDISPGLGIDHEFVGPGDVLAQMRAAISVQHARYFDLKLAGKGGLPNLLTTRDVIKYGTSAGANAVGLGSLTGAVEVGNRADLVILRADKPNIYPVNDPIGAVVWGVDTSNLDWVIADGTAVMREGRLTADVSAAKGLIAAALGPASQLVGGIAAGERS
jgi:cytosine/adenosine deaminase-related metal-dependent hydrolase